MAEFLAGGDAHAALGAKGVSLFRMQQETAARAAIALANFIRDLGSGGIEAWWTSGVRKSSQRKLSKVSP